MPDPYALPDTACVLYSSCAYFSRGHSRIAVNIRDAATRAGVQYVQPTPIDNVRQLAIRVNELATHHRRVLIMRDFPDTPVSVEFTDLLNHFHSTYAARVSSIYIAMKATSRYMEMYRDFKWVPAPYDVVVSIEPGACRTVLPKLGDVAKCGEADIKIAPLVQPIQPVSIDDVNCIKAMIESRSIAHPVLWLRSGTPDEEASTARWLRASLGPRYVSSLEIEDALRLCGLSLCGTIRCASLFNNIIASPGYSTFWELYALGLTARVRKWLKLERPIEDIDGRLRLLDKPQLLDSGTAACLKQQTDAGIAALASVINNHLQ